MSTYKQHDTTYGLTYGRAEGVVAQRHARKEEGAFKQHETMYGITYGRVEGAVADHHEPTFKEPTDLQEKLLQQVRKGRASRNAIIAEKTPRVDFNGWEYYPPPGVEKPVRWKEGGGLFILSSQVEKFKKEEEWQKASQERIRAFEESLKRNEYIKNAEIEEQERKKNLNGQLKTESGFQGTTIRSDSESVLDHHGLSLSLKNFANNGDPNAASNNIVNKCNSNNKPRDVSLEQIPVSHIKSLQLTHPSVLHNYRSIRAANYLKTCPGVSDDPSRPTPKKMEDRGCFYPGGILSRHSKQENNAEGGSKKMKKSTHTVLAPVNVPLPRNEEDLKEELRKLVDALEKTEEQIGRQSLKIALSKKVKTYEKREPR